MKSVLVAAVYSDELLSILQRRFPDHRFVRLPHGGDVPSEAEDATVLLWCSDTNESLKRTLATAPDLQWIHSCTAGLDQLWDPEVATRGITVTRSPETSHIPVAEWAMACLLAMAKQLPLLSTWQSKRVWGEPDPVELFGTTIAIVGTGYIGREVADRASSFGMTTLGVRRSEEPLPQFDETFAATSLAAVLDRSDFLVLCCPLTSATRGLIGWSELVALGPRGLLVNVARGEVIVEADLIKALESGTIAGAALDVFAAEPLASDSPLWEMPNTIITPHAAWRSPQVRIRGVEEFAANLSRFLEGRPLHNVVGERDLG